MNKIKKRTQLIIDSKIYSKNVLFKVIDVLSNEYIIEVSKIKNKYLLTIMPKYHLVFKKIRIKKLIFDHLNNQIIRNRIIKETGIIREMIVGKALFESEAFDNELKRFDIKKYKDEENFMLDKYKISNTFEEQNNEKQSC